MIGQLASPVVEMLGVWAISAALTAWQRVEATRRRVCTIGPVKLRSTSADETDMRGAV